MYHIGLQTLRAKIRGFHAAGSTISRRTSKSEKERRHRLWQLKRELGDHCRHHLIAYAILRGIAYDKVERCSERNRPNPQRVLDIVVAHAPTACRPGWLRAQPLKKYDLAAIEALLAPGAAPTMAQEKAA